MDDDRKPPPTMEEIHEFMITHFLSKTESSTREVARHFLEAREWHIDASVSDFNDAVASTVASSAATTRRNVTNPRDGEDRVDPRVLAARTLSSILHPRVSSPPPIRLRSPRSPPSRARNPFSDDSDEQDQQDAAIPSSSRRLKFRSISEILSVTPELVPITVTVWRNGFTLDTNNRLNTLDDPANASALRFFESLESPRTFDSKDGKQRFVIKLIRRQREDFPPEESPKPFQGVGRTLSEPDSVSTDPPPASSDSLTTEPTPSSVAMEIDLTAPTTLIPVILADGTRIVSRFNTHHTIRDVRNFIDAATPGASSRDYQLIIMGFPPKTLTDLDQTIDQAGISNSLLTQKFY
ncbi:unnamed protein product [Eruca vesicaria subsp. sativa]|uniref:Uncharacterized protein n=1 Tax=Eruca vesicaria subsp. sativa TaxID=29727 RepID=A0ABC8JQL5_ERUVS|nr:unnamed protein product [Eruca vesicaria subsp. sativa]